MYRAIFVLIPRVLRATQAACVDGEPVLFRFYYLRQSLGAAPKTNVLKVVLHDVVLRKFMYLGDSSGPYPAIPAVNCPTTSWL